MAGGNSYKKITRYRRYSMINIGTILFGVIFMYMIICIFLYVTAEHITSYEVTAGSIFGNYRYLALSVKSEEIITSTQSGKVTYYAREGAKASSGMTICSLNEGNYNVSSADEPITLSSADASKIKSAMSSFTLNFDDSSYQNVYNFKADIESSVLQMSQSTDQSSVSILNKCNAPVSGFVVYSIDGMEQLEETDITSDLFNQNNYHKTNLRLNSTVNAGDNLYKLVTSENWALYFPLDSALATELEDLSTIRCRVLRDNNTFNAPFSMVQNGAEYFGKITLNNSLIRYVSDRYLEIELLMNRKTGLKIPTSAIAEKVFYKIPEDYVIPNNDTEDEITLLRETFNKDGSAVVRRVTAKVYAKKDNYYLVDTSLFKVGDYVQMIDTSKKFQIQDSNIETIQGVYNINKGYAIFREVTIIDENEEFCIVEPNNIYGLAAHDYIVLDASTVDADDLM